jgi:ABC-type cobalamin transport system permease subunit
MFPDFFVLDIKRLKIKIQFNSKRFFLNINSDWINIDHTCSFDIIVLETRTIIPNGELPIGIITSLLGAPVFMYMLVKKSYGFGGK